DDHYILFTGGTTGMPKGVVWRHEDVLFALGGGIDVTTNTRIEKPDDLVAKGRAGFPLTHFPLAPLMHGASQWAVMGQSFVGNKVILIAKFDPEEVWKRVGEEKANTLFITGDAMGRPLIEAIKGSGDKYDTSSLLAISSTAAVFSPSVKDEFFEHFPNLVM